MELRAVEAKDIHYPHMPFNVSGSVLIGFQVNDDGTTSDVRVVEEQVGVKNSGFAREVVKSVKKSIYLSSNMPCAAEIWFQYDTPRANS